MQAIELLNNHKLKRTGCREGILNAIIDADQALSEIEIKERLHGNFDRTTFYRSFKTLLENNIIHKIVVDNQIIKYALETTATNEIKHAHFYCTRCQQVKCMVTIPVLQYQLPEGYSNEQTEVLIKGTCALCKQQD